MPQPDLSNLTRRRLNHPPSGELDYLEELDNKSLSIVQQCTCEIKALSKRTGIDTVKIGENVLTVKQQLKYGQFGRWLKAEFGWSKKTSYRFINVYNCFNCVNLTQVDIALSALYELAASAVPPAARQEALERGAQGERISVGKARAIVQRHKNLSVTHVTPEVLPPIASAQIIPQPCTTINIQSEASAIPQQDHQISFQNEGDPGLGLNQFPPVEIQSIEIDDSVLKQNPVQEMEVRAPGLRVEFLSRSGDIVSWFQQQSSTLANKLVS